jgi:uncharacterized protein
MSKALRRPRFSAPPQGEGRGGAPFLYFLFTFAWTWLFWWSAAVSGVSWGSPTTFVLYAAGGVGPVLTAGCLVHFREGLDARRSFWRSVIDWRRIPALWWPLILVLAVAPYVVGRLVTGSEGPWLGVGASTVLVSGVVAGLFEEPGWRGYAQDRLQQRRHVLTAAVIVGVFWSVWHLPLFFIDGTFQNKLGPGSGEFWLFMIALVLLAIVYAAVYVGTGRSILAVVLLHALANAAAETMSVDGAEGVETLAIAVLGIAAVLALLRRRTGPR